MNVVVAIFYPLLVWIGIRTVGVRITSLAMIVLLGQAALRKLARDRRATRALLVPALAIGALYGLAAWLESDQLVRMLPACVSLVILSSFASSLVVGPPLVERFAQAMHPEPLSDERKLHCCRWTIRWVAFLLLQSAGLAWAGVTLSVAHWAAYVGAVSYPLMGVMFVLELLERRARFRDALPVPTFLRSSRVLARWAGRNGRADGTPSV